MALGSYAAVQKLSTWQGVDVVYEEIGVWLKSRGVPADTVVMVGNPPGFYYHTSLSSVVVPNGDVDMLLDVCERYAVNYLVLDSNHPAPLRALYEGRVVSPQLVSVATFKEGRARVWKVER